MINKFIIPIFLSLMILLVSSFVSANTITENGFRITSDKDNYHCEPIYRGEYCLIKANIEVENLNNQAYATEISSQYTTHISYINYPGHSKIGFDRIQFPLFIKNSKINFPIEFYVKEDGKFNITIDVKQLGTGTHLFSTILDPTYNVTINASHPSLLLQFGDVMVNSSNDFTYQTDISIGLSDGLSNTTYQTTYSWLPRGIELSQIIEGYGFNQIDYVTQLHSWTGQYGGVISGVLFNREFSDGLGIGYPRYMYGAYFDGSSNVVVQHNHRLNPDIGNFSVCSLFNTTSTTDQNIITKENGADGWYMETLADGRARCEMDGTSGAKSLTSSSTVNNGSLVLVCCIKYDTTFELYVNGVLEDSGPANMGNVSNTLDMYIGSAFGGSNKFTGTMKQLGIATAPLSSASQLGMVERKSISDTRDGIAVSAFFNHTLVENETYFLAVDSTVNGLHIFRVMSYIDLVNVNLTNFLDYKLSAGLNFIPLSNLVSPGYNNPFRIFGFNSFIDTLINNIYLYESIEDDTPPSITDCFINNTNPTCGEVVRWQCNVTDNQAISNVKFQGNSSITDLIIWEQAFREGDIYYTENSKIDEFNESKVVIWQYVNATDLVGNINTTPIFLSLNYTCLSACIPDWNLSYIDNTFCFINDTYQATKSYEDLNSCGNFTSMPGDNGTVESLYCDYCTPDWVIGGSECYENNTLYIEYDDNNNCYAQTLLATDNCSYSFSDCDSFIGCDFYTTDFITSCDSEPIMRPRIDCFIDLNTSDVYKCITYVRQGKNVLQTNPQQLIKTGSLFWSQNIEAREVFTTQNGLTQIYYTDKNIIAYTPFVLGIRCNNNHTTKIYEMEIIPQYDKLEIVPAFGVWFKDNILLAIGAGFIIFIIVVILGLMIAELRRTT